MKLSTIVTIASVIAGAAVAAFVIHGKSDTDVEATETTGTTEVETESTTEA